MRIYINKEERSFLRGILFEYIEDFLAEGQINEDFECVEPDELEQIHSLLKKLSNKPIRANRRIRYVYEKL